MRGQSTTSNNENLLFPVLCNIERPLELEMLVVVIVKELGDCFIVSSNHHTAWSLIFLNCTSKGSANASRPGILCFELTLLLVEWFVLGIRSITALHCTLDSVSTTSIELNLPASPHPCQHEYPSSL
jgi:hypothetical protein